MNAPIKQLSLYTNSNELSNLLGSDKFKIFSVNFYGAVADDMTDNRQAIQDTFDKIDDGDVVYFPNGTYSVINAIGSGATLVQQRADAVANSTLYPITCSKNNITVIFEGIVKGTSILGNIFEFTGNRVKIKGNGGVQGLGGSDSTGFLDTNSTNPLLQWEPSLIKLSGDYCKINGITLIDPPTIGIHLTGSHCNIDVTTIEGGRVTHSSTVSFGIYCNPGHFTKVTHSTSKKNSLGGVVYDFIFNSGGEGCIFIENTVEDVLEHAIYNYGDDCIISNNILNCTSQVSGLIQSFANGSIIKSNILKHCYSGGISVQGGLNTTIDDNTLYDVSASQAGIVFRHLTTNPNTFRANNIKILNNKIYSKSDLTMQGGIDIRLTYGAKDLKIVGNSIYSPGTDSGIVIYGANGYEITESKIENNNIYDSAGYSIVTQYLDNSAIKGNIMVDGNTANAGQSMAIRMAYCDGNTIEDNLARDTRGGSALNDYLIYEESNCSGAKIINNTGLGLTGAATIINANLTSIVYGNRKSTLGLSGEVTMTNAASKAFTSSDDPNIENIMTFNSKVIITPTNAAAALLQGSAKHVYPSTWSNGTFTLATADGNATGVATATYRWEVIQ